MRDSSVASLPQKDNWRLLGQPLILLVYRSKVPTSHGWELAVFGLGFDDALNESDQLSEPRRFLITRNDSIVPVEALDGRVVFDFEIVRRVRFKGSHHRVGPNSSEDLWIAEEINLNHLVFDLVKVRIGEHEASGNSPVEDQVFCVGVLEGIQLIPGSYAVAQLEVEVSAFRRKA
jgi:hypothetical protein